MLHKRIMDPADNGVEKCERPSSSNALAAPPGQRLGFATQSPAQLRRGGGRKFLVLSPLLGMGNPPPPFVLIGHAASLTPY